MIVHNEATLDEAVALVLEGTIKYSDEFQYRTVTTEEHLRGLASQAFSRNDVAIVAPLGQERTMEVHSVARREVRVMRAELEKVAIKKFLDDNPEIKQAKTVEEAIKILHAKQRGG